MRSDRKTNLARIALAGAILLALMQSQFARGQDDWNADERAAGRPAAMMAPQIDMERQMSHMIFGGSNDAQAKKRIDAILKLRLDSIEQAGGLSKAQLDKLRLAGRGDVIRFFRKVEDVKKECKVLNFNDQRFRQIWPKINALKTELDSGLFQEGSLFQKAIVGIARSDPSTPYQEQERQRRKFRHRAAIELAVTMFELGVPLMEAQRQKFLKLLVEELKPPRKFGNRDQYVVFYQASKLDQEKLKAIFDDAQWRALNQMFRRAKGMERQLKKEGYLP